ncbi:hypothetical protein [Endozoicomonas sp. GU-1]|nr:hypothetical protein [Endozoicomonas sp. GU-1]WBA79891.1 hypothetical protein O2T12_16160 [Endozoicomonas sp. GU-1]
MGNPDKGFAGRTVKSAITVLSAAVIIAASSTIAHAQKAEASDKDSDDGVPLYTVLADGESGGQLQQKRRANINPQNLSVSRDFKFYNQVAALDLTDPVQAETFLKFMDIRLAEKNLNEEVVLVGNNESETRAQEVVVPVEQTVVTAEQQRGLKPEVENETGVVRQMPVNTAITRDSKAREAKVVRPTKLDKGREQQGPRSGSVQKDNSKVSDAKSAVVKEKDQARLARVNEARQAREQARKKAEEQRLARETEEKAKAEELRLAEEQRRAKRKAKAEELRLAKEKRKAEEKAKAEALRAAEEKRKAEEKVKAEALRMAEEKRKAEEEKAKAEALRVAEEKRKVEEEKAKAEPLRLAEEKRKTEEKAKADELKVAEEKRKAEEKAREEKAKAEELKLAEEKQKAEEKAREEKAKAEELRLAEEKRKAEEKVREEKAKAEELKLAEEKLKAEEKNKAEKAQVEKKKRGKVEALAQEKKRKDEERERIRKERAKNSSLLKRKSTKLPWCNRNQIKQNHPKRPLSTFYPAALWRIRLQQNRIPASSTLIRPLPAASRWQAHTWIKVNTAIISSRIIEAGSLSMLWLSGMCWWNTGTTVSIITTAAFSSPWAVAIRPLLKVRQPVMKSRWAVKLVKFWY